jgi:hypothetical protein
MLALGHKRTFCNVEVMSALPPESGHWLSGCDVRFVPKADILRCSKERRYSIALPAAQAWVLRSMLSCANAGFC